MILTDYTTTDEIRGLLGVTAKELTDTVINLPHWLSAVEQEMRDIDGGVGAVLTMFDTVKVISAGARTAAQTQFFKVTCMYVAYAMTAQFLPSADVFNPVSIGDGKAQIARLEERFDKLRPAIEGGLQRLLERVKDALLVLSPSAAISAAAARVMFQGVGLGVDPVTGV